MFGRALDCKVSLVYFAYQIINWLLTIYEVIQWGREGPVRI